MLSTCHIFFSRKLTQFLESYTDPKICFLKRPKKAGSELLYFKSMLTTEERQLLVGFDRDGKPIPLNEVKKYSPDFHAFFKILVAG